MNAPQLQQITAQPDGTYGVVITDTAGEQQTLRCTVSSGRDVPVVAADPDLFMAGRLGNPRLVIAAVVAFHQARQAG
ncbi:hypothetical protein [Longispora albida]|uniref:hypothetical protein n=1 Tax=Longispora albida TaxID=203523 RepID=UPI00037B6DC6|nr:hypothetical protein [Longispora albida]